MKNWSSSTATSVPMAPGTRIVLGSAQNCAAPVTTGLALITSGTDTSKKSQKPPYTPSVDARAESSPTTMTRRPSRSMLSSQSCSSVTSVSDRGRRVL